MNLHRLRYLQTEMQSLTNSNHIIIQRVSFFIMQRVSEFSNLPTRDRLMHYGSFLDFLKHVTGAKIVEPVIYRSYADTRILHPFLSHGYYFEWGSSHHVAQFVLENEIVIQDNIYWCFLCDS